MPTTWLDENTNANEKLPKSIEEYSVEGENPPYSSYGDEDENGLQLQDLNQECQDAFITFRDPLGS